jgi:hypothetical protein
MAWGYRASITVDNTKVSGASDLSNFKVLVAGTFAGAGGIPDLRTVANGGKVTSASGYDIAFFSDSALTTMLDFERVSWSASTGVSEFWVRIPTLATASDTVFYIGYGDSGVTTDQQDKPGTWDTTYYKAVYHFEGNSNDSGTSGYNGTDTGVTYGAAKVGQGIIYDGSASYTQAGTTLMNGTLTSGMVMGWIYPTADGSDGGTTYKQPTIWGTDGIYHGLMREATNKKLRVYWYTTGPNNYDSTNAINQDAWTHIAVTWSSSDNNTKIYINGALDSTSSAGQGYFATASHSGQTVWMGANGATPSDLFGKMDEWQFITGVRPTGDWIATEYNNQSSPSTFYAVGAETSTTTTRGFITANSKFW